MGTRGSTSPGAGSYFNRPSAAEHQTQTLSAEKLSWCPPCLGSKFHSGLVKGLAVAAQAHWDDQGQPRGHSLRNLTGLPHAGLGHILSEETVGVRSDDSSRNRNAYGRFCAIIALHLCRIAS
jgi:hypothetical protein